MTASASRFRYFVAVSPGLELMLRAELERYGIAAEVTAGGVECTGPLETLWRIHHCSRIAESVRLRLRPFRASDFAHLERGLRRLPWHAYLEPNCRLNISVTCHQSRLFHTKAIAERALRVASECTTARAPAATAPRTEPLPAETREQKLYVRIERDIVQVSVDASGERLHRRGYRTHVVSAPLRETLAAAAIHVLLALPGGRDVSAVWDPFCGSGTLLCEWLLKDVAPGATERRHYAFEFWPIHNAAAHGHWLETQQSLMPAVHDYRAFGSDSDPRAIAAATNNLLLAKVAERSDLHTFDFREAAKQIPLNTAVVTNLPYGVRLQDREGASRVFLAFDELLRRRNDLRPVVALNALAPPRGTKGRWQRMVTFSNGGIGVSAWSLT